MDASSRLAGLAADLDLDLSAAGTPGNPLVVVDLDVWRTAEPEALAAAARLVAAALPVTVGVLAGTADPVLAPLIEASTLTLAGGRPAAGDPAGRAVVPCEDLGYELDQALSLLRTSVAHSPRAAVACGQLLRQTSALAPRAGVGTTAALAAEAAAYSMLLGGPEFARWLAARGAPRRRRPPADPVRLSRDGGRLSIELHDPARRNAFSTPLREGLLAALELAAADDTIDEVELHGAGPAFCSGGDLDEFGRATDLAAAALVRLARAPWRVLDGIAAKTTVYAHGACVGAGTEVAAYAGRVIAAPDAYFALPEVRMGLVPGAGGSVSVPRRIGRHRAAWLMLTGDPLPAAAARRWGLADAVGDAPAPAT